MDFKTIQLAYDAGVATITLNRPDKRNAISFELIDDLQGALDEVAKATGKTVPQVALNWLLQRPSVATVICGARNEEQLRQNLGAVGWRLSSEQVAKIDQAGNVTPVYPYWHQRQFVERNPAPVL